MSILNGCTDLITGITGAVSSVPFDPKNITGLVLWLRGDQGITNVSGKVSNWSDLSGKGNDVSQSTAGNRPVYNSNPLNGQSTLAFTDTNSSYLVAASRSDLAPTTITTIMVSRYTNTQSIAFVGGRGDTGFNGYWTAFGNANMTVFGGTTSDEVQVSASSSVVINEWCIIGEVFDGTNVTLYKNGSQLATHALAGNTLTYVGNPNFYVGTTTGLVSGRFLTGDIAEVFIFNRSLNANERTAINQYLGDRYNISVS